ncbi:hypothetical protein ACHAXA_010633 [Cyclostephanos tholiformis]|uniref:Uncharacterized protein n=1 Tax=Cyclostephanos tholiformis TaxID=382380 RepID=A0ABD3RNN7_9STRA
MIDASMRGENAGESDTRFIKRRKKMLVSALRGPKLYDFRREVLRFDKIKNGGEVANDDEDDYDDEIVDSEESEESNDTEDESDGEEEVSDDDGKRTTTTKKKKTDPPLERSPLDRPLSPPPPPLLMPPPTGHRSSGGESSSVDEDDGENNEDEGESFRRGRRSLGLKGSKSSGGEGGGDHSTASESGSSANSRESGAEEISTVDGFSTSATSSKHHKRKDKRRDKKSSSRKKERKRLKKEERRRRKEKKKRRREEKRRRAEKRLLVAEKQGSKKRKREFNNNGNSSEDADADNASISGEEDHEGADDRDSDSADESTAHRQRPPKRRGFQLTTKKEFEIFRSEWLNRVPKEIKSRFREGGFSKWGKDWLPVLELGPFDVEPGPVREMWFEMFRNTQENGRDLTRLVFWYGVKFEDRGQAYSFLPESKIVRYEEGERLGYCKLPKKIQQKVEKGAKLTKTEEQIRRGLTEIESDILKDKSERVSWMMQWKEDYEYVEEEARVEALAESRLAEELGHQKKNGLERPKKEEGVALEEPIKRKPGRPKKSLDSLPLEAKKKLKKSIDSLPLDDDDGVRKAKKKSKMSVDSLSLDEENVVSQAKKKLKKSVDVPPPDKEDGVAKAKKKAKKSVDVPPSDEEDGVVKAKKKAKKSVDVLLSDEEDGVIKAKKKGPGRPKKSDKEKTERFDEKALAKVAASSKKKKESTAKIWETIDGDHESEIETEEDENDRDYDDHVENDSDGDIYADEDDDNFDSGVDESLRKKRKVASSSEKPKKIAKPLTDEEKIIKQRARAADYRQKKARERAEAQGLEYTKGKVGRKSNATLLEEEQLKFTKCEDVFLPIMEKLTQAKDDTNAKVALNCIDSITERVELLTPPFLRDYSLGMLVKSVRKTFEIVHPEVRDCCKRLTTEMKRVYTEKENKVPDNFEPVKNYKFAPNAKEDTSDGKRRPIAPNFAPDLVKSERVIVEKDAIKGEKIELEQTVPSRHNSEMNLSESVTRKMASTNTSDHIPNLVTSDPPQPRPKKTFSIKGMFDKPKPAAKPIIPAPTSNTATSGQPSPKPKSLPSWVTGPAVKKEDFHEQHLKERTLGLDFLFDASSSAMTSDKFDPVSVSQSFELAIFAETKLRGRDWHQYWEKIHDVVAMLSPGKGKRNSIFQGIISGDYQEPSELVKLSRREIQSLNQLKN